jgi:hypothetical protein
LTLGAFQTLGASLTRSDIYKRGPSAVCEDRIGAFGREGGDTRHLEKTSRWK